MKYAKKLIEVSLPLEAINKASAREKNNPFVRTHPRNLHLWWARRPLVAARAVIFSQMVDDPSEYTETLLSDPNKKRAAICELAKRKIAWEERKIRYEEACRQSDRSFPDPGPEPTLQDCVADIERERLFRIIEDLVLWENTTNETVLQQARDEIWQSWRRACAWNADHPRAKELFDRYKLPAFHDPFAGGGALPLEAQRLGLESYASDLNPVAVLINKAMIEIPPKFAGNPPVNPKSRGDKELFKKGWSGAQGLAEDVRYYGKWMRDEAEKRIGRLYPKIEITTEMAQERPDLKPLVGRKLTVIAWLWARTVKSPNPAFANVDVPLASTFMLSTKAGKEAYVEPVIEGSGYRFRVKAGKPKDATAANNGTKLSHGANFQCLLSGTPITGDYIKGEGKSGRMGARLMAIVAKGDRVRVYLAPTRDTEEVVHNAKPNWLPEGVLVEDGRAFTPTLYGLKKWSDLFTARQLIALSTFSDLVPDLHAQVRHDACVSGISDDGLKLDADGTGVRAYADAIAVYVGMSISQYTRFIANFAIWNTANENIAHGFGRQAIPMTWDYPEANTLNGNLTIETAISWIAAPLAAGTLGSTKGTAIQEDAVLNSLSENNVVSTDPPYYDNVPYADLSDFFYVWLRRSLRTIFPDLFATMAVPKDEELIVTSYRHGGKIKAETFFMEGMTQAMHRLAEKVHPAFPVTIYYAFKQSETGKSGTASTGWETFLQAVIQAGFAIAGTWPMRTERAERMRGKLSNALASSIILVCRKRAATIPTATRREFVTVLKSELPIALAHMQRGNIAPVDLAQAAIGPGMAVYTRYAKVLDAEGKPLTVREALALINQTLDEALAEQEGDFDADSRWAVAWFEQSGFAEGEYGVAEVLSKAKATSIDGMKRDGILTSISGKVRLLRPEELSINWDPEKDQRITAWEMVHQLIRALEVGGEGAAATLVAKLGAKAEIARELAYRLYTLCERKKRAVEALSYNALVQSWPEITRLAREGGKPRHEAPGLFDEEERE